MRLGPPIVSVLLVQACFAEANVVMPADASSSTGGSQPASSDESQATDPGSSATSQGANPPESSGTEGSGLGGSSVDDSDSTSAGARTDTEESTSGASTTDSSTTDSSTTDGSEGKAETTAEDGGSSSSEGSATVHAIFISAMTYSADLGGLAGADGICEILGATTDVSGPWVAVLSDAENLLETRITIAGPVELLDGTPIADDAIEFFSGTAMNPVGLTENDGEPADTVAWVGAANGDCDGWTSSNGAVLGQQALSTQLDGWLYGSSLGPCSLSRSLYCISQ